MKSFLKRKAALASRLAVPGQILGDGQLQGFGQFARGAIFGVDLRPVRGEFLARPVEGRGDRALADRDDRFN